MDRPTCEKLIGHRRPVSCNRNPVWAVDWAPTRTRQHEVEDRRWWTVQHPNSKCRHLIKGRMSSTGERMPGLEKQRWIERVAQNGRALEYAAAELRLSRALQWISTTNLALHCAKLRLAMATCTLPTSLCRGGGTLSALPRDLTELIGTCITVDLLICVVARKYGYWFDGGSPVHAREDSRRKKHKRS